LDETANLTVVRNLLKEQRLKRFLEMSGNIYPDLVKVFYTNLQFVCNILNSHVKGWTLKSPMRFGLP